MRFTFLKKIFASEKSLKKNKPRRYLIKVCAWCPKEDYPTLRSDEEFTHGLCRKHYRQLSLHKNLSFSFKIAEKIETSYRSFEVKQRKSSTKVIEYAKKQVNVLKKAFQMDLDALKNAI